MDLFAECHNLERVRNAAQSSKEKLEKIKLYIRKVRPFDLIPAQTTDTFLGGPPVPEAQLEATQNAAVELRDTKVQTEADSLLIMQIKELQVTLQKGHFRKERLMKKFEDIREERKLKDIHYIRKIAEIFNVPEELVPAIIHACSSSE
jgi:ribosomal protein S19